MYNILTNLTWNGSMLLLLSVLKGSGGSEIIQGFCRALWYFGGAMTLLGKSFFVGEMGLSGDGTPSPSASPRVSAAPGVRRGAPRRVLVVIPGGRRSRRRGHFIDERLVAVGVPLVHTQRRPSHLRGKITSEHRVDVMGKVLKMHRPVYRRNPLEKALVYGVGGPSVAERRRERGVLRETQIR